MSRNITIKSLAVLMLLAMFNFTSFAQDGRERIKFTKGKSTAVLKRVVSGNAGTITFILYAKKGKIMNFTVDGNADLGISLSETGSQDYILRSEPGEPNEYRIAKSGDHFITVVNHSNRKANFTLRVVIN
jgi:uncharacterized surface anchored protein